MILRTAFMTAMRGTYCLVLGLGIDSSIRIGSLGMREFPAGLYVYVGSALSGIEGRVSRHRSSKKKRRWHIDYLLDRAEVLSVIAIPTDGRSAECQVLQALAGCEEASVPVNGFGSSDCGCKSHLVHFGDAEPEWVAEVISRRISMLDGVYPRTCDQ